MEVLAKKIEFEGRVFDSQLEADWFATLESWGFRVHHHPGRIHLPGTAEWWEPDFLILPAFDGGPEVLAEVKGPGGDRLWKPALAEEHHGMGVVILRPGLVMPGTANETAGAVWHGTQAWGLEWVVEFDPVLGKPTFTREPDTLNSLVRVSAERCVVRPEVSGLGMRKALGRSVG
jgi:hypothetical protein